MKILGLAIGVVGLCAAGAAVAAGGESTGDAARGKTVFARCVACHDLNTGATRFGPSLKGVVGRKAGSIAGYAYSPAMKAHNVTWTPATLDTYLTAPTKAVPGTKMAFAGVPNAQDRADLIAYLNLAAH